MKWLTLVVLAVFSLGLRFTHAGPLPQALARSAKEHGVRMDELGLYVHVVGARSPRLAHNAALPMNPASTMKLLTTAAALHILGPAHTWRTQIYSDGAVKEGVLEGNLILKGAGDPKLTLEEFWLALRQLRARGVQHIRGDVLLDRSLFETANGTSGDFDGDSLRPYNVLPDALLVNFNAVRLDFLPRPDSRSVQILMHPPLPQIHIANQLQAVDAPCNDWPQDPAHEAGSARLVFTGNFPRACGETTRNYSPLSAPLYVNAVFRALWSELGGTLSGQVRDAPLPPTAQLVTTQESEPLSEVIRDINKFSNNVMARQLFLAMGLPTNQPPLNAEKSVQAIKQWLEKESLQFSELVMENGSGLSRKERISSEHLGELLLRMAKSPLAPEFIASLPLSGIDGTMRKRLNDSAASGRAHIKTGYLDGVRASVGYVQDEKERLVVVVCLVNGSSANVSKPFHDAVIEWAHANPKKKSCCRK